MVAWTTANWLMDLVATVLNGLERRYGAERAALMLETWAARL